MPDDKPAHSGGRKRAGTLFETKSGWSGKYWTVDEHGQPFRKTVSLGRSKPAAKRALARLVADPTYDPSAPETFQQAGERIMAERPAHLSKHEHPRLKKWVYPEIGHLPVTKVGARDILPVLLACKKAGLAKQTTLHVKQAMRAVFEALVHEGVIDLSPVPSKLGSIYSKAEVKAAKLRREVLTDDELNQYLVWQHPDKRHAGAALERQIMSLVARVVGGLRTAELHAMTWEAIDAANGLFAVATIEREKTGDQQTFEIPGRLRPYLEHWWKLQGEPVTGPVFPARRGARAGKRKGKVSHADAFRRDLKRAFGLELPKLVERVRSNGRKLTEVTWEPGREPTERERALLEGTQKSLPVDFHSWRRAMVGALAAAGVNAQQAAGITNHKDLETHGLYLSAAKSSKYRKELYRVSGSQKSLTGLLLLRKWSG